MKKTIIIAVTILVAGVAVYLLLPILKPITGGKGVEINRGTVVNKVAEVFTGSLKSAIEKGVPIKCTTPKNEATGTEVIAGFFKGHKYYGEVVTGEKHGYIIMVDNCIWSWEKDTKIGVKICSNTDNMWDFPEESTGIYSCSLAVFSDSIFTPPSDIQFMDIASQMQE